MVFIQTDQIKMYIEVRESILIECQPNNIIEYIRLIIISFLQMKVLLFVALLISTQALKNGECNAATCKNVAFDCVNEDKW